MSSIIGKDTKPVMLLRKFLHAHGYRYRLHDKKLPGKPGIVLPKYKKLLEDAAVKDIPVSSLQYLSDNKKMEVYAFVIMPNHVHFTCLPSGKFGKSWKWITKKCHIYRF